MTMGSYGLEVASRTVRIIRGEYECVGLMAVSSFLRLLGDRC
jgi:hypothetical protein